MIGRLARVLGIQAGEGAPVAWLIVHSLFNGIFSALFLTAANALFLARFEIGVLPLAYIAAAVVGYVAVGLLSRLERHVRFGTLLLLNLGVLLALASAFWIVGRFTDADWVVFLMFVVVGPMFNLIALGYWGLAGRLFDLRQGKRLFGLVGAGEEVSTIAGLFATPLVIRLVGGAANLVPLAAIGLAGSFVTVVFITRRFHKELESGAGLTTGKKAETGMRFTDLLRERYFLLMAASVVLLTLALYTIDFSFLAQIRLRFQGPGQIAQFFGVFYGAVKIVEFLLKVGVSGPLLNQFGLNVGLLVLPIVLGISTVLGILVGTLGLGDSNFFVLVALAKLLAVSGRTSTFEPSFRVLYQPLGPSERIVYQSHVEGTARQLSVGVVGLALLLFSRNGTFNALALFYVLLPILGLWIVAAIMVHREYRVRLFEGLKGRAPLPALPTPAELVRAFLQRHPQADRDAAAQLVERIEPRPAAVAATGPASPETRMLLVRQLSAPRHAAAASAALAELGAAAIPDLDRAFTQADQTPAVRRRIVNILGAMNAPEAQAQLLARLDVPDRAIRRRVIALLSAAGYQARPEDVPQIERVVETLIRDMAWDMNVLVALHDDAESGDVREALEAELSESRAWLFELLAFLYDSTAIKGVRDILAGGSPQATVYALEILDMLLSPVLKPYVFALVEGQSHLAVVRKLETLVAREHLTAYDALRALVRRDYGRIGMWTRALALDRLGRAGDTIGPDVVAFLFHPEPLLREVAATRIAARDPKAWEAHRKRLSFDVRESLDTVVRAGDADAEGDAHSIFGRARLLGFVPGFSTLAPEDRLALASASELRALQPGQRLPAPRDPEHAFYVTMSGELTLRDAGGATLRLTPLTLFTFVPGTPSVEATAEALLIRLDPAQVFELAAENPDIVPGLLQAVDTRRSCVAHD
jgi:hypothetical protein